VKEIEVPLRFSSSILRRLGEELNPSPDQSILELVKNSYDADAVDCTIELIKTDHPGGTIKICDNGDGMDAIAIRDGWLVLGQSLKPPGGLTRLKRIRAGSKGLGRLAALRMGSFATLISRPRKDPNRQFRLTIDWSDYDRVAIVEDVILTIKEEPSPEKSRAGTEIILENLRDSITRIDVKKLARSLLLLADPFGENPEGFRPILKAPEFSDLEALVKNRYFKDAEYHLIASVDKRGKAQAVVVDWRGEELFSVNHKDLSDSEEELYKCSPAKFDLWVFILNKATFDTRSSTKEEVQNWLKTFGGVHLYQNGLRVNPYGNPGNDWLEMNLMRVRSPEERPSTNTSIGRVSVLDADELLVQKTDRSGFIESDAFLELKRFATDALEWMAKRRLEVAEKRRVKERIDATSEAKSAKKSVEEIIKKSPKSVRKGLMIAFDKYDKVRRKETNILRKEVQLYRTLGTAGITAATFAHESAGNPIKVISLAANTIARRGHKLFGEKYTSNLEEPVGLIRKSIDALKVLGNVTLSLTDHEKRRAGRVGIHKVIKNLIETFQPFLAEREVNVIPDFAPDSKPFLRGSEAAFESIITNFLNNSIVWFEGMQIEERKVVISTRIAGDILTLRVFDNGPGIVGISIKDIWLPGYTTRPNGTGLGLTIVRDAVTDLGGTVDAIEHGELGGAEFVIELPILGV
jgi:signal transduction histidine kinase